MRKRSSASFGAQREMAWRNRLARFAASKLTIEALCLGEAVSVAAPSPFIDLGSLSTGSIRSTGPKQAPTTDYTPATIDIRLELGGGVIVYIVKR